MENTVSPLQALSYRAYHFALRMALLVYPIPRPQCFHSDEFATWLNQLKAQNIQHLLIVTDDALLKLGVPNALIDSLNDNGIKTTVFSEILPDPDINEIEQGYLAYLANHCQGIVAIGGGSVIDAAKLIGVRIAKPKVPLPKLKGLFKVLRKLPSLTAVPTTAGTGSETTVAAVASNRQSNEKFAIADYCLAPKYALLMPELTKGLPASITATTAMDALTHAIEAYIGINGTQFTNTQSLKACKLIFDNLPLALQTPHDVAIRANLLNASFFAGEAFTRTSVGYVHAIAHQLGAKYHVAHGLANAVLLDVVLLEFGDVVEHRLAEIADYCELSYPQDNSQRKATRVIEQIQKLKQSANIPSRLSEIRTSDIKGLALAAQLEAHPDYPVPAFWSLRRFEKVIGAISEA
jgi:alcohol dehydrogenase class IV